MPKRHKYRNSTLSKAAAQTNVINQMAAGYGQSQELPRGDWNSFFNTIRTATRAEKKVLRPQIYEDLKCLQSLTAKIQTRKQEVIQHGQVLRRQECGSSSKLASKTMQWRHKDNVHTLKSGRKRPLRSKNGARTTKQPKLIAAKHPKIDENAKLRASLMKQCSTILNKLMSRFELSWIFLRPVDAVKLNLPDYDQIISKPMDLGTIKTKLQNKVYTSPLQFAEDVRLTFENAMKYNPEDQDPHKMARDLLQLFESRWRLLSKKLEQLALTDGLNVDSGSNKDQVLIQTHILPPTIPLATVVRDTYKIRSDQGFQSGNTVVKYSHKQNPRPVQKPVTAVVSTPKAPNEKHSSRQSDNFEDEDVDIGDDIHLTSFPPVVIDRDGSPTHDQSSSSSSDSDSSSSDSSSGSSDSDSCEASALDSCSLTAATLNEKESVCDEPSATPALTIEGTERPLSPIFEETLASSEKGGVTEQLPPERLVRAALLKGRFVDTILKAEEELLSHKPTGADPQEREELLRQKRATLHAEAEAVALKERLQRDAERQAARQALQQMEVAAEPPVDFDSWGDLDSSGSNFHTFQFSKLGKLLSS